MNDSTYHFSKDIKSRSHGTLKEMYKVILNQISSHEEYTVRVMCSDKTVKIIHNDLSRMIELQGCKVVLDKDGVIVKKDKAPRSIIRRAYVTVENFIDNSGKLEPGRKLFSNHTKELFSSDNNRRLIGTFKAFKKEGGFEVIQINESSETYGCCAVTVEIQATLTYE